MELAQQISVEHTRKIFGGNLGLMFYDVTTLYFETAQTDMLRDPGFSKDGKTAESQVVLGLLVSEGGYPLSYSLFNGSQYEGFTMITMIDDFKQRFTLGDDFVVVADSGLMNRNNIALLQQAGYKYILGARIKNESADIKQWILSLAKKDKACYEYKRKNGERLITINNIGMSVDHVLDAAKTITTIRIKMPENGTCFTKTLFLTEKHLAVRPLFREGDNEILFG